MLNMLNRVLIDSGPLIAIFDTDDNHHIAMLKFLSKYQCCFVSTIAVFTEVSHMLDFNTKAQNDFYKWVMHKGVIINDISQSDMPRLVELTEKYADLPMDFADATLLITAEKTGIREIISLDKHFDIYRLSTGKKFAAERLHNLYFPSLRKSRG